MSEAFFLQFARDGRTLPISRFTLLDSPSWPPGLTLDGEWSAWPLGLALNLAPANKRTRLAMARVRRQQGWRPGEFMLQLVNEQDRLRVSGVADDALPAGRYVLSVRLSATRLLRERHDVVLRASGAPPLITIQERPHSRLLRLSRTVDEFPEPLRDIVRHERSYLDGRPAADWVDNHHDQVRDRRLACFLNILAKLAALPSREYQFKTDIQYVYFADVDRVYAAAAPAILDRLRESRKFRRDRAVHAAHRKLLRTIPHARRGDYALHSYREGNRPSLQVVVAEPPHDVRERTHYLDLDIDLGNPSWDVASFVIHVGEVLHPDRTDHLNLWNRLRRTALGPHLYYTAETR